MPPGLRESLGRAGAVLIAALAGSACAPEDPAGPTYVPLVAPWKSGTRLRATLRVGSDGARIFEHWYDTALDLDCSFAPTAMGYRCLPLARGRGAHATQTCTDEGALTLTRGCPGLPGHDDRVALEPEAGTCPLQWSAAEAMGSGWGISVYRRSGDTCTQQRSDVTNDRRAEPLDVAQFATATASLARVGDVGIRQLQTAGGAQQRLALTDPDGLECDQGQLEGHGRCVPGPILTARVFADANCSTPAAEDTSCGEARYARRTGSEEFFALGPALEVFYAQTDGGCEPVQEPTALAYALQAAVPRESFPQLERVLMDADDFVPQWWRHQSETLIWDPKGWLLDNRACDTRSFLDYEACLSIGLDSVPHAPILGPYADADCTVRTEDLGASASTVGFIAERDRECQGRYLSPIAVAEHHGPVFGFDDSGACSEIERDPNWKLVVHSEDRSRLRRFTFEIE